MLFTKFFITFQLALLCVLSVFSQDNNDLQPLYLGLQDQINHQLLIQADSGNLEQIRLLIELGSDPNTQSWDGLTPVMYASLNGHYSAVREFIAVGSDLNAQTNDELTALHYATIYNHDSIAELLILNGAHVHPVNYIGISPLHYACAYGYPFLTDLLVYYGAFIDSSDYYGNTPLLTAVYSGSSLSAEVLLREWANVDKPDLKGFTPLMIAAQYNDTTIMRLLVDYGADVYKRNREGATALALAIKNRAEDAVTLLLEKNAAHEELHPSTSYAELAQYYGLFNVSRSLVDFGGGFSWKLQLSSLTISTGLLVNNSDFYLQSSLLACFSNYGIYLGVDLSFRPYYKPVLVEEPLASYQFFEKRRIVSATLLKSLFTVYRPKGSRNIFAFGVKGAHSWGAYSYSNAVRKPSVYWLVSPVVGYVYQKDNLNLSMQGYFLRMDHIRNQPFFVSLSCGYSFGFSKPKIRNKRIEWL